MNLRAHFSRKSRDNIASGLVDWIAGQILSNWVMCNTWDTLDGEGEGGGEREGIGRVIIVVWGGGEEGRRGREERR